MKRMPALLCLLALAACSGKPPEPQARPVNTPFDGMRADEQHARDVQKVIDRQAADQRKQAEAQQP